MNYSRQRELIYKTVVENPIHPTADTVYAIVRAQEPNISLGTVYRNLNLLSQQGLLQKICLPNASDCFDGRCDEHHHMLCTHCGKVFDLPFTLKLEELKKQAGAFPGFLITGCQILFHGLCAECRGKH